MRELKKVAAAHWLEQHVTRDSRERIFASSEVYMNEGIVTDPERNSPKGIP